MRQPRGQRRVEAVGFEDFVGQEAVAPAVGGMEMRDVAAECAEQGAGFVGVLQVERGVLQGGLYLLRCVCAAAGRNQGEVFVHYQRIVGEFFGKLRQQAVAFGTDDVVDGAEYAPFVGHVLRHFAVLFGDGSNVRGVGAQDVGAAGVAQGAPAGQIGTVFVTRCGRCGLLLGGGFVVQAAELRQEAGGDGVEQGFARAVDEQGVDVVVFRPQVGFGR